MKFIMFLISGFMLQTAFAQDNQLMLIFDGRLSLKPANIAQTEKMQLETKIIPLAIAKAKEEEKEICDFKQNIIDDFNVIDKAIGAFTQSNFKETAYLYEYCIFGHFATTGIAIVKNQSFDLIDIYLPFQFRFNNMGALVDFNQNGLDEIVLSSKDTHQGSTAVGMTLLEVGKNGEHVKIFGNTIVYQDDCLYWEDGCRKISAYKIYAKPSLNPIFYREEFIKKSEKTSWKKISKQPLPFSLEKIQE
jgi:hypothetical protein